MSIRRLVSRLQRQRRPRFAPSAAERRAVQYEQMLADVRGELEDRERLQQFYDLRRERAHTRFPLEEPPVSEREEALGEMLDALRLERNLLESILGVAERAADAEDQYRRGDA